MIADLKADSDRWEAERRQTASRGQPLNGISSRDSNGMARNSNTPIVEYRSSTTHQSRQHYGPTETTPSATSSQGYGGGAPVYPSSGSGAQQGVYDNGYQTPAYGQAPAVYPVPGYPSPDPYYVGGDYAVDQRPGRPSTSQQPGNIPRTGTVQYTNTPYPPADNRVYTHPGGHTAPSPVPYPPGSSQQPQEFYSRDSRGAYNQLLSSKLFLCRCKPSLTV